MRWTLSDALTLFLASLTAAIPAARAQSIPQTYFSDLQWRLIGPFRAGRSVAVGGVGTSSPVFFFGSVGGGVWKTTDAGMVWQPVFDSAPVASIGALEVAPSDPNVVYVGTGETDIRSDLASGDGVYQSTDAGATWHNVGLHDTLQISKIVVDPRDPKTVYVAALGSAYGSSADRGVYKSNNGGKTWQHVLFQDAATGAADLAIASGKPTTLFACMWDAHRPPWSQYPPTLGSGSGLYRSTDAGATWQKLSEHGLPTGRWGRSGVAVSADGRRIFALIEAAKAGLYVSDDGGDTWQLRNSDTRLTGRDWYFSRITIDPQDPSTFYVPNTALYRSTDAGKTITVVRGAPGGDDYHELWIDPANSARMVLGTDHGTTISIDHGATWTSWYNQPTGQMYHVAVNDEFPYIVFGAQQDDGSLGISSRTDHETINARDWSIAGQSESGYIALDPLHPNLLYLTSSFGGVVRYDRNTHLAKDIAPWPEPTFSGDISQRRYRATWTPVIAMSPADKRSLYFGTQYVLKTIDGGDHWTKISPDLTGAEPAAVHGATAPPSDDAVNAALRSSVSQAEQTDPPTIQNATARGYGTIFSIAPSPREPGTIWTGSDTGLVYLTRNGGQTWRNVTPPALGPWSKISLIEASTFDPAVAYIAVDRHRLNDRAPYLFRTDDFGKTWTKIVEGISAPDFTYVLREDAKQRGLLFAGTEFGIFVSFNNGAHWQPLQLNLPVTSVRDLVVHGDDLVIATHGRAFWILDDITPLRQIAQAQAAHAPFFYQPATALRVDHDPFPSTRVPVDEPTAKNPPEGAVLDYYLPSAANEVRLQIFDSKQRLVRMFSSAQPDPPSSPKPVVADAWRQAPEPLRLTPGMHRFVWGLTWSSTGEMDGDLPDPGSGLRLPRVSPGSYRVVLTVDGKQLTRSLEVKIDPRAHTSQAALDAQQELGVRVYQSYIAAGALLDELHAATGSHTGRSSQLNDESQPRMESDTFAQQARRLLGGDARSDKPAQRMGIVQIQNALASDLAAIRSGYEAPTEQERQLSQELAEVLNVRRAEWSRLSNSTHGPTHAESLRKEGAVLR